MSDRCEPGNVVVEGCTAYNTITLDATVVRGLVEALEGMMKWQTFEEARAAADVTRAALAAAKEAGL